MHYLSAQRISKGFSEKKLFTDVNFNIQDDSKIALFGRNGKGKTTLLRIIAQQQIPDQGTIQKRSDLNIIYLNQDNLFDYEKSVLENILHIDNEQIKLVKAYDAALLHPSGDEDMESLLIKMEEMGAWGLESEIQKITTKLGVQPLLDQPMKSLSGGQLKRTAIARSLIEVFVSTEHTLLMLDEPTNHLDLEMIDWLQGYLSRINIALIMVTHDRYFLDAICNEIWDLDNGKLKVYKGDYEYFIEQKTMEESAQEASIAKAKNTYARELEWMRKQPKARTTKSKSRIDRFAGVEEQAKQQVKKEYVQLHLNTERLGSKIVEMKQVCKAFGNKQVLKNFTHTFNKGEKIGLIGKNGEGKTTFLNMLQHLETLDSGTIKVGETVKFGYFNQKGLQYDKDYRVIEYVKNIAEFFPLTRGETISAANFLELFLFHRDKQYTHLSSLSGGEKRRLQLLTTLFRNPNFLILDEPTNDLDMDTLMVLEKFLQDFEGCLLLVSHDRRFMDTIVDSLFILENGNITIYPGNYSDYSEFVERNKSAEKDSPTSSPKSTPPVEEKTPTAPAPKLSYKHKFEMESIEKELSSLEIEKTRILKAMESSHILSFEEIEQLTLDLKTTMDSIAQKEARWLELQPQ